MTLPRNTIFCSSERGAKGFHYPSGLWGLTEDLTLIERLFYVNTENLIAFRISEEDMVRLSLPNNTIWIQENDYQRIRT